MTENSNHRKILRKISTRLQKLGFEKYKSSFFLRQSGEIVQFIHLHKFTFAPEYRVHLGIKLSNSKDENFYLNGLDSSPYQYKDSPNGKKYNFRFHEKDESIERCVENLFQFCIDVGEKWFDEYNDIEKFLELNKFSTV